MCRRDRGRQGLTSSGDHELPLQRHVQTLRHHLAQGRRFAARQVVCSPAHLTVYIPVKPWSSERLHCCRVIPGRTRSAGEISDGSKNAGGEAGSRFIFSASRHSTKSARIDRTMFRVLGARLRTKALHWNKTRYMSVLSKHGRGIDSQLL